MSFRDNLQHLRDTLDMSQADLAQQLGVSRQSVAKWEAEKSYPEMDKLIKICDLFECSLDDLVRGDLAGSEPASAELAVVDGPAASEGSAGANELAALEGPMASDESAVSDESTVAAEGAPTDVYGYDDHMRRRAWDYAAGVAVLVMGYGVSMFVTGGGSFGSLTIIVAVNLAGVALCFLLFRTAHRGHEAFRCEHPFVEDFYTPEEKAKARRRKACGVAGGVAVALAAFIVPQPFHFFHATLFATLAVFGCFALAAALVVYSVMMDRRTDVARYNRLSAVAPAGEPDESATPTAGDTVAS